ncbi:MAG: ABC transporter substrate-binding protein [Pseudolabrys sp.]|jgi:polar amino acid transport system substrate-binding protein
MHLFSIAVALLALAGSAVAQDAPPDALKDLAPTGKLRAAINLGNGVLAQKDPASSEPKGITPDLARELAKRLGVRLEMVVFESAGKVFDGAKTGAWDVAFIAIEPVRAAEIEFTAPYVIIEGTYMVPMNSPLKTVTDVDRPGVRIAVGRGAAYDLYLTRTLKDATLVRAEGGGGSALIEAFVTEKLEAAAGVRQALEAYAKTHPEVMVMQDKFMEIRQAMGAPKGRTAGAKYLSAFVEDMKTSGFVADALKRSNQSATVAPPAK